MRISFFFAFRTLGLYAIVLALPNLNNSLHADEKSKQTQEELQLDSHDLKEKWKLFLLQNLFQQRIEEYKHTLYVAHSEDAFEKSPFFLSYLEKMQSEAFSEEELKIVKHEIINQLRLRSALDDSIVAPTLASYYADDYIPGKNNLPFSKFLNISQEIVDQIQIPDLISYLDTFLKEDARNMRFFYLESTNSHSECHQNNWMFDNATNETSIRLADNYLNADIALITCDNLGCGSIDPFYQLPLPEKEQKLIHDLIKTMAEKNIWGLLFKKKELERVGKKINHVHPMRFMGCILSDPKLRKCLKEVKNSSFKWDHFIDGFTNRMKEENAKNNLLPYVPGMAHLLQANPDQMMTFIQNKDYEGLVKFLL